MTEEKPEVEIGKPEINVQKSEVKKLRKHHAILSEPIRIDDPEFFTELLRDVEAMSYPYKNPLYREQFLLRDKALVCFLILTGCRITEALQIRMKQIVETANFVKVLKVQTEKFNLSREEILMPRKGRLAPFTAIFYQWYQQVKHEGRRWHRDVYVFPQGVSGLKRHRHYNKDPEARVEGFYWNEHLRRKRASDLIHKYTGKFPHYYRHVYETYYGRIVCQRDAWALKEHMGYRRLESSASYVKGATPEQEQRLLNL